MRYLFLINFLLNVYFVQAQSNITKDQWRSDLVRLRDELPKRHPRPFQRISEAEYKKAVDELAANLQGKSDLEIALEAQALVARIGDNQTRIDLTKLLQRERVIPAGFGQYADGLYVSGTVMRFKELLGKKVIKINGMEPREVLKKLARFTSAENEAALDKDGWLWLRFPVVFRSLGISDSDTLKMLVENAKGVRKELPLYALEIKNVPPEDMVPAQFTRAKPDLRWEPVQAMFYVRYLEQDSILYFQYNSAYSQEWAFAAGDSTLAERLPPFKWFADTTVAMLKQWPQARLFIDLRFNPGGWANDAKALADRLVQMPEANKPDKLFVAVNNFTALAAVEIANYFGEKTKASLIGESPAQLPNHSGEAGSFPLQNSGLEVFYSKEFPEITKKSPKFLKLDKTIPISFEDFKGGKDPVLDYVRKLKD